MNTIQKLSQVASQLPPDYQEDLLAYAQHMLEHSEPAVLNEAEIERERRVQEIILERYITYKQSGQKGRLLDDVLQEIRTTYGL